MSNDCMFQLRAFSRSREALLRLIDIMRYEDNAYHLYRVKDLFVDTDNITSNEDGIWSATLEGDVAWSCGMWIPNEGYSDEDLAMAYPSDRGTTCVSFGRVCKELNIGLECWAMEPGVGFQEHFIINANGELTLNDSIDWSPFEDDVDDDTPTLTVGLPDELYHPRETDYNNYGDLTVDPKELLK